MKKFIERIVTLACCLTMTSSMVNAEDISTPEHWRMGDTNLLSLNEGQLCYSSKLTGNVSIPPYYFRVNADLTGREVVMVDRIIGSSHSGTIVQAPAHRMKASSWYYDGPFLDAVIDTLRLPQTITKIGNGAFENGTVNVLICDATTPPSAEKVNKSSHPVFSAKLIVPTGSLSAYSEHDFWSMFSAIEEGAENYMPAHLISERGGWYEVYNGSGSVVKGSGVLADAVSYKGTLYNICSLGMASIDPYTIGSVTLNAHITEFNPNYHLATSDSYFQQHVTRYKIYLDSIHVSPDNSAYASVDGILYSKDYKKLLYFSRKYGTNGRIHVIPICCEEIAEEGIPTTSEMGSGTIICPRPLSEMCSGTVGVRVQVMNHFPVVIGDSIRALWNREAQCFDLHGYNTQMKDIAIPSTLTSYGTTLPVKTVGKYKLDEEYDYYDFFNSNKWGYGGFQMGWISDTDVERKFFKSLNAETAVIPENIDEVYNVFAGATNLRTVHLPQSLKIIGWGTFGSCNNLTDIELPSQLERIDNYAFINCVKLEKIVIPASVSIIGPNAFKNCSALHDIYCLGQTPPMIIEPYKDPSQVNDVPFSQLFGTSSPTPSSCTLHVPAGTLEAYRSAWVWKEFENIVEDADASGVNSVVSTSATPIAIYDISGRKTSGCRGLNIVRMDDGTVRKVIINKTR